MATNFNNWGDDVPSSYHVHQMEKEDEYRRYRLEKEERRIDSYLRNNPGASYVEADYYTRNN